jgi:hypothetical protein
MWPALRYTPFGDLKEGDTYIRLGGRPVLLRDTRGFWLGDRWCLMDRSFDVYIMAKNENGVLGERRYEQQENVS